MKSIKSSIQVFKYSSIQVFKYRIYKLVTDTLHIVNNVKSRDPIGSKKTDIGDSTHRTIINCYGMCLAGKSGLRVGEVWQRWFLPCQAPGMSSEVHH